MPATTFGPFGCYLIGGPNECCIKDEKDTISYPHGTNINQPWFRDPNGGNSYLIHSSEVLPRDNGYIPDLDPTFVNL